MALAFSNLAVSTGGARHNCYTMFCYLRIMDNVIKNSGGTITARIGTGGFEVRYSSPRAMFKGMALLLPSELQAIRCDIATSTAYFVIRPKRGVK